MSYDICIWSVHPAEHAKQLLLHMGFKELSENSYALQMESWQITLDQDTTDAVEEIPDQVRSLRPDIQYLLSMNLEPISAPDAAYAKLIECAEALAEETIGVVEDMQADSYWVPSGASNAPRKRLAILESSWWLERRMYVCAALLLAMLGVHAYVISHSSP